MRTATSLRALFGWGGGAPVRHTPRLEAGRNVMMHVTVDAQHVTPLRQALIRDCGDQPWTLRITPLHGTDRMRLSLYLPKAGVEEAMQRIKRMTPAAQFGRLLEIPDSQTGAWRDLSHAESRPRAADSRGREASRHEEQVISQLLTEDHVLLGLDLPDRQALFRYAGYFFEAQHGLSAASVSASLEAREALGSTGLGQGVAVPHGRIKGLRQPLALYIRPAAAIRFDAPDGCAVSDAVILLVPEWANSVHLRLLAEIAQRFCDHHFREQLHACADARSVAQLFAGVNESIS